MKVTVKRVKGGVVIKLGLRHARNLMDILNYSGLNERFERDYRAEFDSGEIVSEMLFSKFEDEGIKTFV